MALKKQLISADFETTTNPDELPVRVWGSCAVDIDTLETVQLGNSIETLFDYLRGKNTVCYYHNLKFDGEFILSYLFKNGYTYSEKSEPGTFRTLITDMGLFYSIEVIFSKKNKELSKVTFYDSLKKLPLKVATIAKAFNLEMEKLTIDYDAPRPVGHELTEEERAYIVVDCRIVAAALKMQFAEGLTKMTNASDAMTEFKELFGKKQFERYFPVFPYELDHDLRAAYKGGFVYLNPKYEGIRGLQGVTLDVNSLYPSVMYNELLPYGYPIYFEGEPHPDEAFPLFIVRIECGFDLKPDHLPTIQIKNSSRFMPTEYIKTTDGDIIELTLTNVDLALFLDHYDVYGLRYLRGFKFHGIRGIFKEYIDKWMHIKETTTGGRRQLAKLMLNSLYGRFGLNPRAAKKIPYMDSDGVVRYKLDEVEERDPVYIPMAAFITAYARNKTIRSGQAVYDRFIYADTDSLHLVGMYEPDGLEIHKTKLGAWKNEGFFTDSKFIRAKTYMETTDEGTKVTCAGMPDNVKEQVTYDNFHPGSTFDGKLVPRRYPGGIILEPTTFTIK